MTTEFDRGLLSDLLIESSIDAMIAIGVDESIIIWNQAAASLFDRKPGEMLGKDLFSMLPSLKEDPGYQTAIKWARDGKKSFLAASINFPHRSHVETHVIPLRRGENVVGVMLLLHDVSHRIAKEIELENLNKELKTRLRQLNIINDELAQLTHLASHNVREPIREIYTAVEWLVGSEAGAMSASGKATFRRIQSSLNRMNLLLDDIITLTQINILERPVKVLKLAELVEEVKNQFSKKLLNSKAVFTVGELCDLPANRNHILLLLQQVLSNIIKHSDEWSPKIHISCERTEYVTQKGENTRAGEYYKLSILHNSTALESADPDLTPHMSDVSNTRNYTGPTMAIVLLSKIMELHAGFVVVKKKTDGEASIQFFFPVKQMP